MSIRSLLSAILSAACLPVAAQPQVAQPRPYTAVAVRVEHAPKLDGTLSDPLWNRATPVVDFRQREPMEGQASTEATEVRIVYTRSEIYFGILCRDSDTKRIVATQLRRDVSQALDDYFEIIIDSRYDRRNAYVFQINPLGTQRDALIADERHGDSDDGDPGWDGVWFSEARITDEGWTATVAIPFSTMNLMTSTDVVWGINFKRFIRHKNEEDLWSAWHRTFGSSKISQAGTLQGVTDIGSGRLFIIKPYGLLGLNHLPSNAHAAGLNPGFTGLHTAGVDVKLGIRSNIVANLTGNTDFADSDVDVQRFNLTPYQLFYPEKRQFFLENAGVFNFAVGGDNDQLFFSRQIGIDPVTGQQVPINGGAKVTGSLDGFEFGIMDVNTRHSGPNPYANFAVGRLKYSLGGGSYIGAMGIDKRSGNPFDPFNQTAGIDARFVLFKTLRLTGFATETRTPGISSGQTDVGGGVSYRTNWVDFFYDHRTIGANFNPEVGFLERPDCQCDYAETDFKYRPQLLGIREMQFDGSFFHGPGLHGEVENQQWQATFRAEFHNGSYTDDDIVEADAQRLTEPFNIYKNVSIPVGVYNWTRHQITYGSPQDKRWTINFYERFGSYYDGRLNEARIRSGYRRSERLSFSFSEQWNRFRLPVNNGNFSVLFGALETDYAFSRFFSLATVFQMDTSNAQAATANIRLRWNYRPDSDFYVIYNAGQQFASLADNAARYYQHRFVVKYTYSWRP